MKKYVLYLMFLLSPGLVLATPRGYWPGNGDYLDYSGNGNTLKLVGTVPNPSCCPVPPEGHNWLFSGPTFAGNYLLAPSGAINFANTGQASVWFWLNSTNSTTAGGILEIKMGSSGQDYIGFSVSGTTGTLELSYTNASGTLTVTNTALTINDGANHLIRFTDNPSSGLKLYVDGSLQCRDNGGCLLDVNYWTELSYDSKTGGHADSLTFVDAMQFGDSATDAYSGPSTPTTPTITPTNSPTWTPTSTPTNTPTNSPVYSFTPTPTVSSTLTPTQTYHQSLTATRTPSPTASPTYTTSPTPINTKTCTTSPTTSNTPVSTSTYTYTKTKTPVVTPTPVYSNTPTSITGYIQDLLCEGALAGLTFTASNPQYMYEALLPVTVTASAKAVTFNARSFLHVRPTNITVHTWVTVEYDSNTTTPIWGWILGGGDGNKNYQDFYRENGFNSIMYLKYYTDGSVNTLAIVNNW